MTPESGDGKSSFKSRIGESVGPFSETIREAKVAAFRTSVGDSGVQEVPPTFLTAFRQCEFDLFTKLGIQLSKVLHAEQEYSFERPLRVGDPITYLTKLANVLEKRGTNSLLVFMVIETHFFSGDGMEDSKKLAFSKTTIVVRETLEGKRS